MNEDLFFVQAVADLLRISAGLMVDENCKSLAHGLEENEMIPFCSLCDGTGIINRSARAQDIREFILTSLNRFPLKSGGVLHQGEIKNMEPDAIGFSESAKNGLKPSQFISRDNIDDAYDQLYEENKKLSEKLNIQRQRVYEAFEALGFWGRACARLQKKVKEHREANAHEYTRGYAQRYVDMQESGLNEIMWKAEGYDRLKKHLEYDAKYENDVLTVHTIRGILDGSDKRYGQERTHGNSYGKPLEGTLPK